MNSLKKTDKIDMTAQELYDKGYRIVSRKYCTVARVDISDEEMVAKFIKENFGDATSGVPSCDIERQRDFYRRVCSKDTLTLHNSVLKELYAIINSR